MDLKESFALFADVCISQGVKASQRLVSHALSIMLFVFMQLLVVTLVSCMFTGTVILSNVDTVMPCCLVISPLLCKLQQKFALML